MLPMPQLIRATHLVLLLILQVISIGINIFCMQAIVGDSMPVSILISYRFICGAITLSPFVIHYKSRISTPTKPGWKVLCNAIVTGLLGGSLFQNLYLESMASTSPTFISAIVNLTPAIAFLLCLAFKCPRNFRLESLSAKRYAKIKVAGVALSIVGATLLASFKHLQINTWPVKFGFLQWRQQQQQKHDNQIMGLILALLSTLSNASFLTIQGKFNVDRGNIFLVPFLMNLMAADVIYPMAAIQSVVYALFAEKDKAQWKLGWNVRLWAAFFAGVLGSGLSTTIITWCISEMGPLFVSTANPFGLILMTATGYFLLGEKLYVTSLAAIALIVAAVLLILWAEVKELSDKEAERSDHQEVELSAVSEV